MRPAHLGIALTIAATVIASQPSPHGHADAELQSRTSLSPAWIGEAIARPLNVWIDLPPKSSLPQAAQSVNTNSLAVQRAAQKHLKKVRARPSRLKAVKRTAQPASVDAQSIASATLRRKPAREQESPELKSRRVAWERKEATRSKLLRAAGDSPSAQQAEEIAHAGLLARKAGVEYYHYRWPNTAMDSAGLSFAEALLGVQLVQQNTHRARKAGDSVKAARWNEATDEAERRFTAAKLDPANEDKVIQYRLYNARKSFRALEKKRKQKQAGSSTGSSSPSTPSTEAASSTVTDEDAVELPDTPTMKALLRDMDANELW